MRVVPLGKWMRYELPQLGQLRNLPGCYVVFNGGIVVYVGEAERVRVRLMRGHRVRPMGGGIAATAWGPLHEFCVKVRYDARYAERLTLEARLIRRLRPSRNTRHQRRYGRMRSTAAVPEWNHPLNVE